MLTIHLGASNVYLLPAGDGYVAIDAGPDYEGAWTSARAQMTAAGIELHNVRHVLLTHGHPDHCALASYWQRRAGTEVWVAAADVPKVESGGRDPLPVREMALDFLAANGVPGEMIAASRSRPPRRSHAGRGSADEQGRLQNLRSIAAEHGEWPAPLRATPATPDRLIEHQQRVDVEGLRLQPIICPGHTPASTVFLDEETGDLFTGDHVLERIAPTPGIHFGAAGSRFRSLPHYIRSLEAVRELSPRRVLPGHGEPFTDLAGAVDRTIGFFEQRARRVVRRLRDGPASAYGIALQLYPHLPTAATWVVMAEIVGLLDLLEERGQVTQIPGEALSYRSA